MTNYSSLTNFPFQRAFSIQPFLTSDEFSPDEVARMLKHFSQDILRPADLVEGVVNKEIRVSNVKFYYPDESTFWIFDKINKIIELNNRHVWNFDLNGYESFQYSEYLAQQGGKYDFHTDIDYAGGSTGGDPQTRKLSMSLILNEQGVDYEGGDFQVLIGSQPISLPQTPGSIILFPSWVLHRVTPVTRGVRKSIVVWVTGPKFR